MVCAIWGTTSEERPPSGEYRDINSPRAGGWYRLSNSADLSVLSLQQKKSLSRWLQKQHSLGVTLPEIDQTNLDTTTSLTPLKFTQQVNAALNWFHTKNFRIDSVFTIIRIEPDDNFLSFVGTTDSDDYEEAVALLRMMVRAGLLSDNGHTSSAFRFGIEPLGWQRMEQISLTATDSRQAFVAMWFSPTTEAAYNEGISPAILQAGYNPLRIDKKHHVNKVDDEIIAEIRRSRFVVSDFTCELQKPRGGVYFEAGFAMGLNIPVIWTCHSKSMNDLHFDTRQYNHIVWDDPTELKSRLESRICALIGDGPQKQR